MEKQNLKNQFLDLSYLYTFKKSKIDFEIKWTNILNTRKYEEIIINDYGLVSNTFIIRPSQVFVSLKFNFN
jgi:hypothetical protein